MKHIRRSFLRNYQATPVVIRRNGDRKNMPAQINDCCRGGLQLGVERYFEPGAQIVILASGYEVAVVGDATQEGRSAEVVWCQGSRDGASHPFIMGVQFVLPV
jgi:hypothetical protein